MTMRELAIYTAGAAHQKQEYGESPYVYHLSAADKVLGDVGYSEITSVRIAIWLHDVLEDSTIFTKEDLEKRFGPSITNLVWRVTNEPGPNRKERAKATYPKIAEDEGAIALKLVDRISNLEHSIKTFSRFGLMYVQEDVGFRESLYRNPIDIRIILLWERYSIAVQNIKLIFGIN